MGSGCELTRWSMVGRCGGAYPPVPPLAVSSFAAVLTGDTVTGYDQLEGDGGFVTPRSPITP